MFEGRNDVGDDGAEEDCGRSSKVGEADRLRQGIDHRPGSRCPARGAARAGVGVVFEEKASGTKRDGRTELQKVLSVLGEGDALVLLASTAWAGPSGI